MGRIAPALVLIGGIAGAIVIVNGGSLRDPAGPGGPGAVRAVPGEYVVTFGNGIAGVPREDSSLREVELIRRAVAQSEAAEAAVVAAGGTIRFRYRFALVGFSGALPPAALEAVGRAAAGGVRIEPNWEARQSPAADGLIGTARAAAPPPMPPQGLDRIGQRLLDLDYQFERPTAGPRKVHVFVIDSGFLRTHSEFLREGSGVSRVGKGGDAVLGKIEPRCLQHGTHVAGIIGGRTFGIASAAEFHSVRVIDCSNVVTTDRVIAAVNWVAQQFLTGSRPAVANMSLEFNLLTLTAKERQAFGSMDTAIGNLMKLGIPVVAAAGNNKRAACNVSPARIPDAITVGSTDPESDERADTSNFGRCVKLFAPGVAIVSAAAKTNNDWAFGSGTSSAAPHVTGVAALILSRPSAAPGSVWPAIHAAANVCGETPDWSGVKDRGEESPNMLLHWDFSSEDGLGNSEQIDPAPPPCP